MISHISRPECLTTTDQLIALRKILKNGDAVCCQVGWELSNFAIPGTFKHVGIYVDGWIHESTTHNTRRVLLEEFFFKKDKIGVARRKGGLTDDQVIRGLGFMNENMGEPYDFGFELEGSAAWYCSKFARAFFIAGEPKFEQDFKLRSIFGEPTVQPDDFWLAKDFFDQVISFNI